MPKAMTPNMNFPPEEQREPGTFYAFAYPQPNTLIQVGTQVRIKDLKSEAGKLLNGKTAVALEFFMDHEEAARWVVVLDDETTGTSKAEEKVKKSIKAENLVLAERITIHMCFVTSDPNPPALVTAGTMWDGRDGTPGLCICDDPKRPGFDAEAVVACFKRMGLPDADHESVYNFLRNAAGTGEPPASVEQTELNE